MKIKLLFLYVFEFLRDGYYVGIFLLLPFIAKEIHLNLFQVGSLQATVNVLSFLLAIVNAHLSAKFGGLKMLIFSLCLYAISFIGINFANSYSLLFIFFFIAGVAFSFYSVVSPHLMASTFKKETRGKDIGNLMAVGDVSKAIISVMMAFFVGLIGWRLTSFSIGFFSFLVFLTFSFIYAKYLRKDEDKQKEVQKSNNNISYKILLKQRKFILALGATGLDMAVNTPFYAFLPFLLLYKGVPVVWLGIFTAFYYIGNILSRLIFGRLVDKIGNAKIFIYLEITMAIITFLLVISPNLILTGILALMLGFITEGTDPATQSMIAASLEHLQYPKIAYGLRSTTTGITRTLSPLLLGLVAAKFGITGVFYTISIATLLPIIPAWLFMKEK